MAKKVKKKTQGDVLKAMKKAMDSVPVQQMTDEEVKAASDKRRAARKKQNIMIHPDHIENLDERDEKEKRSAVEVAETGYTTDIRLVSRKSRMNWLRRLLNRKLEILQNPGEKLLPEQIIRKVELRRKFVESKVVTRCIAWMNDSKRGSMYFIPVPLEHMQRTSVCHIHKYSFSWLRRYAYYADMDMTPTSEYVMVMTGVDPRNLTSQRYKVTEVTGKDRHLGEMMHYRIEAIR